MDLKSVPTAFPTLCIAALSGFLMASAHFFNREALGIGKTLSAIGFTLLLFGCCCVLFGMIISVKRREVLRLRKAHVLAAAWWFPGAIVFNICVGLIFIAQAPLGFSEIVNRVVTTTCVMIGSIVLFGDRFSPRKFAGIMLCLVGSVLLIVQMSGSQFAGAVPELEIWIWPTLIAGVALGWAVLFFDKWNRIVDSKRREGLSYVLFHHGLLLGLGGGALYLLAPILQPGAELTFSNDFMRNACIFGFLLALSQVCAVYSSMRKMQSASRDVARYGTSFVTMIFLGFFFAEGPMSAVILVCVAAVVSGICLQKDKPKN